MASRALVIGTAVLAVLAGGAGWATGHSLSGPGTAVPTALTPTATATPTGTPTPGPTATVSPLDRGKRATVRLEPDTGGYFGSGTIIAASGLLLTNAHVAAPEAPGLAFHYQETDFGPNPTYLTVSVNPPGDGPAVATYRATPLVADGYLDLAVARIDAMADGSPLPAGTTFPFVPLAASGSVSTGDRLTVLGYPGVAGGGVSLSVTEGEVATFLGDPNHRVNTPRFEIDTSARIAGGNSGGAAISAGGELIGVPSAATRGGEYSGRIRPVALAEPLLVAVARGKPYLSPYDVVGTGKEDGQPLGWSDEGAACTAAYDDLPAGGYELAGAAEVSGMTHGEDLLYGLYRTDQDEPLEEFLTTWGGGKKGCAEHAFSSSDTDGFPAGDYELRVQVGPQLRLLVSVPLSLQDGGD